MDPILPIDGIVGVQYLRGSGKYEEFRQQYATSSCEPEHPMNPEIIVDAKCKQDIVVAIQHAKKFKIAVAVRSGGHQYSGASSTTSKNIQLDLKKTFKKTDSASEEDNDLYFYKIDKKAYVRTSVSWSLKDLNDFLGKHQAFVPHGQCSYVSLGGHVQTGGYGQLGRSFGLLGDHVRSLEIVDHDGNFKNVTMASNPELFYAILGGSHEINPELFYAILGGSPGNLGVITHFTIEVHLDSDHIFSNKSLRPHGLKSFYWYDPKTLERLLDIVVEMSENEDFPRNYDLCVSLLSSAAAASVQGLAPEEYTEMREHHPELLGDDNNLPHPRTIVVYAQWVPFEETDDLDKAMAWFTRISKGSYWGWVVTKRMSELTPKWLFWDEKEFKHPYIKRTHLTKSTTLSKGGWASWVSERIDLLVKPHGNKIWVSAQFQCFGGKHSKFVTNAYNGTSYSWRDSTVVCVLDCFYGSDVAKETVKGWHKENDRVLIGEGDPKESIPPGIFSKDDRRVLWGSYGGYDLDENWKFYYEDFAKYHKLGLARAAADPEGVFTPNKFCVKPA